MNTNFINSLEILLDYNEILKHKKSRYLQEKFSKLFEKDLDTLKILTLMKELDKKNDSLRLQKQEDIVAVLDCIENIKRPFLIKTSFKELENLLKDSFFFKAKFLGLSFSLKNEGYYFLRELKRNIVNFALPLTKQILENSWKILKPSQYNLFYVLYDFFNDFLNRYQNFSKSIENSFLFLEGIANNFLKILFDKNALKNLKESIILSLDENNDETIDFLFFIENLLREGQKASLATYMLEFYSVFYRKKISLQNLFEKKSIKKIPSNRYFTTYKVDALKRQYLKDLIKIQKHQEKNLFSLKYLLESSDKIKNFIAREKSVKLEISEENFLEIIFLFSERFLKYFKPILLEKVLILNNGLVEEIRVFEKVWDSFFWALSSYIEDLKELEIKGRKYTLKDYKKFIDAGINEKREIDSISIVVQKIIWEISLTFEILLNFLYLDYSLAYTEDQKQFLSLLQLRHFPISEKNSESLIPYSDFLLQDYGKTVKELLTEAACLLGNFLLFSQEKIITEKIKVKEKLFNKNESNIRKILQYSFL